MNATSNATVVRARDLSLLLADAISAREPVLVCGAPGVGKTDIVAQAAALAGEDLIQMHPVVSDPTDFKGLPGFDKKTGLAEFFPYGQLRKMQEATKLTVVDIEDVGQSSGMTQSSLMQLLLAREINGVKISDYVTFIATTNRREDKAGVTGILEPVKSRFTGGIYTLEVNEEDWIEWAIGAGLNIDVIAFVKFRKGWLSKFVATNDLTNSPSPRTVAALARKVDRNLPAHLEMAAYSGIVGQAFTTEFLGFRPIRQKIHNVMTNPMTADIPTEPSVLYSIAIAMARKAERKNMSDIVDFANRLPDEFGVFMITTAERLNPDVVNTKAYIEYRTKTQNLWK